MTDPKVNDRVIVRIDYRDQYGTVTRVLPRRQVQVVTDSGDTRTWPVSNIRKVEVQ